MKRKSLEEVMVVTYTNVFKDILRSVFQDDKELSSDFHLSPSKRQNDIEKEIDKMALMMAGDLVGRLKEKGYLEKEPTKEELEQIIRQVLSQHGVKE